METNSISIIINGQHGAVELKGTTVQMLGPWAGSSGSRSYEVEDPEAHDAGRLYAAAEAEYDRNKVLPFAVGTGLVEQEWKLLRQLPCGSIAVQLPAWHRGVVALTLEAYGMKPSSEAECCWVWGAHSRITIELAHRLLNPILSPNTRFTDEKALAKDIDSAVWGAGHPYRTLLHPSQPLNRHN